MSLDNAKRPMLDYPAMFRSTLRTTSQAVTWLVPLVVVLEFVGSTYGEPLLTSLGFLALLVGAAWLASPDPLALPTPAPDADFPRRLLGIALAEAGLLLTAPAWLSLLGHPHASSALDTLNSDRDLATLFSVLGAWPLAVGWAWAGGRRAGPRDYERLGLWVALVFFGLLVAGHRVQGLVVVPQDSAVLGAGAVVLAALIAVRKLPFWVTLAILAALGASLRVAGLAVWSPDPRVRDMLPLVTEAHQALLSGQDPYAIYQMQAGSQVPLTYLPGLWLMSLPAHLLGLDLRLASVGADLVIVGVLGWVARTSPAPTRRWAEALAVALASVWLFSPSVQWNAVYAEPHPWWALWAVTVAAFVRGRYRTGAVLLGVALATRQFSLALLPFGALLLYTKLGWRRALAHLGLTGAAASLLYAPFVFADPEIFWFGTVRWLWEYGPAHQQWFWLKLGLSGTLYQADATEWMSVAQLGSIALMAGLAWAVKRHRAILAAGATAYVVVVMFNRIIWDSFYLGVFVLLAPLVIGGSSEPETPAKVPSKAWISAGWVLFGLSAAVAAAFVWTLVSSYDQTGRDRLATELFKKVRTGDLIVDRSERRLAFVRGSWLLDPSATPAAVAEDLWASALSPDGPWRFQRAWLVTRHDRDDSFRARFAELGTLFESQRVGRYDLGAVTLRDPRWLLSRRMREATVALERNGKALPMTRLAADTWRGPGAVEARAWRCVIGGGRWPLIFAHPMTDADLSLRWESVALTEHLVVMGGLEDRAVQWGRADVWVDVQVEGQPAGRLLIANRPGMRWTVLDTARWKGQQASLTLRLTTPDDAQRRLCVDAAALAAQ